MKKIFKLLSLLLICVLSLSSICCNDDDLPVDFTKLTYVAFGDSITYGVDGNVGKRMETPYPNLVANELKFSNVYNYAISGSTITKINGRVNVNSQYKNAVDNADIVSVMIGINDYARSAILGSIEDDDLTSVYGGLNVLVKGLKQKYPSAYIFFITPFDCCRQGIINNANGVKLPELVTAIKTVCNLNSIPYLDLYTNGQYSMANDPLSDGIHPTQQFFINYTAPQIVEFIKNNYKK